MDLRALFEQGQAAHRSGRLAEAEQAYRQVLRAQAGNVPALHMLGYLEGQRGRFGEAIALLATAARLAPRNQAVLAHYGHALLQAGRNDEALAVYDRVLAIQPDVVDVLYNRSVILSGLGRPAAALAALDDALALQPDTAMLHYSRGVMMGQLLRPQEALVSYDRALALDPGLHLARGNRAMAALNICDWTRTAEIGAELASLVEMGVPFAPLTLQGYSDDKALLLRCARNTIRALAAAPAQAAERHRHDPVRLAYVSYDFRDHAVAHQLMPLIERHDRTRFEVIAISTGPDDGSTTRQRLIKAFDQFHDLAAPDDAQIAQRMRDIGIDIAIDLNGHTGGGRLAIFAGRPAPVQVAWLGYPGTTGADFMDYLIADAIVAPPQDQPFFHETLIALPDTFFPTDPARALGAVPSRAEAGLPPDAFVFCCFNNAWKITQPVFAVWTRLLAAVPGSVLWLKASDAAAKENLQRAARQQDIDPARLVFASDASLPVHLARHALADLFLDTLPYNAHATAADALWAGLPVLTCKGNAFCGRVAASLLHAMGLPELVTENLQDYEALALSLAQGPARLAALKQKLAANRMTTPLFDAERFRVNIEAAFTAMLQRSLGE